MYSYADAGEAVLVRHLIDQGFMPDEVRDIVGKLRDRFGLWPLASAPLEHDGKLMLVREDGEILVSVAIPGHHVLDGTLLDLHDVKSALASGGWVARANRNVHIEVDPERLSGRPTIRGKRIATEAVADLAQREEGRRVLIEDFGLTEDEIADAVSYEAGVKEALAA